MRKQLIPIFSFSEKRKYYGVNPRNSIPSQDFSESDKPEMGFSNEITELKAQLSRNRNA